MFSFKRQSAKKESAPARSEFLEALESRTYFATTPATVTVTVPAPLPTAVISGATVKQRISVNIADNDVVKAHGRATIALFASTDTTLSSDDAQLQTPSSFGVNIAAGHNHTYKILVKSFPQNLDGSYYILAEVTGSAVNPATGASVSTVAITPPQIDLATVSVKAPAKGHAGKHIPVTIDITNDGNTTAKGALAVGFALSELPDGSSPTSLGNLTKKINLKSGKSTKVHFSVPLALGVPTGNQHVVVDLDPSNAFLDSNLANNIMVDQTPTEIT